MDASGSHHLRPLLGSVGRVVVRNDVMGDLQLRKTTVLRVQQRRSHGRDSTTMLAPVSGQLPATNVQPDDGMLARDPGETTTIRRVTFATPNLVRRLNAGAFDVAKYGHGTHSTDDQHLPTAVVDQRR